MLAKERAVIIRMIINPTWCIRKENNLQTMVVYLLAAMIDLTHYLTEDSNLNMAQYCSSAAMAVSIHTHFSVVEVQYSSV